MHKLRVLRSVGQLLRCVGIHVTRTRFWERGVDAFVSCVGDLQIEFNGMALTGSLWHRRELWQMSEGKYEPFTTQLFLEAVTPGMTVCDIGAHLGYYSLLAAQRVGRSGRVHAFEPDYRTFPYLVRNVRDNGMSGIVVPQYKAVCDRTGVVALQLDKINPGGSGLFGRGGETISSQVESTSLDDYLGGESPDVVKVDVEGAELLVLRGMRQTLEQSGSLVLFVECNPRALQAAGFSIQELVDSLLELGFSVSAINEDCHRLEKASGRDRVYAVETIARCIANGQHCNLYCVR